MQLEMVQTSRSQWDVGNIEARRPQSGELVEVRNCRERSTKMDNPGTSLFHGPDIKINNSQNNEEEEDLEDQKRRKEELQNLLTAALDDFNYDESTINSSTNISVASSDELQRAYKNATEPDDQLKLLYGIRLKELTDTRLDFENYKAEQTKAINSLKNKLLLYEAEIRQLKVSQKNSEELLVEKTSTIAELTNALNNKDVQLKSYEKQVENLQFEVSTYQSTINELQMKLQADKNPFNLGAKKFNSEELQKAHQEQVVRLETLLNEQTKRAEIFEKDKIALQQEMQSIIEQQNTMKTEDTNTINAITQTLESAQQQCKDLIDVIEMLTKENKHLQGRIDEAISQEFQEYKNHQTPTLDKATLLKQMEKLNKMLLDKSVQIDSLSYKLRHYENDIKELLEYRQLKCDVYKQDFKQCDNKEHTKSLLLMQNDLQNYRRIIEDKNQQILTLNSTNRELQEKIEEMLMQTRNEIQNLSHKYSLPQLEQMTRELKNAEEKVKELQEKLNTSEERRMSLVQKLEKNGKNIEKELNKDFESQLKNMKNITEKEKDSFQKQIMKLQKELDVSASEIKNLKQFTEKLIDENNTLKMEIKQKDNLNFEQKSSKDISESAEIKNEYVQLKEQLNRVMAHLQKGKVNQGNAINTAALKQDMEEFLSSLKEGFSKDCIEQKIKDWKTLLDMGECLPSGNLNIKQVNDDELHISLQKANSNIKRLEEALDDLRRAKTITEGEKCTFQFQLKDCESQLEQASKTIEYYKIEIENLTGLLKEKEDIINTMKNDYRYLKEQLNMKDSALKISEEDKLELRELLQKVKLQLEESEKEVLKMQNQITEIKEKSVRRNLEKELKEAENQLEQSRIEDGNVGDSEYFKNCLQAEVLKTELKLRDDLQREYLNKIKDVEAKYHKVCSATAEGYKEEIEKLKKQEIQYREQLSKILAECARKIYEFENEKQQLVSQINYVRAEYNEFKKRVIVNEGNYRQLIKMLQTDAERNADEWKKWSKQVVTNCLKLEAVNKSSRDKLVFGMKNADSEVAAIEKSYKEKLKRLTKNAKHT